MANTTANDWDETSPAITDARRNGAAEILSLRQGTRLRLDKEHVATATGGAGGEHKGGSAKCYLQTSAPTTRPDGVTALTAADNGRIWVHSTTGVAKVYKHSSWLDLDTATADTIDTFERTPAYPISLPETESGLTNGTWMVFLYGTIGTVGESSSLTLSATINSVTKTILIDNYPDGNAPFMMIFLVTVSGGTISWTAHSGLGRVVSMMGFRVS